MREVKVGFDLDGVIAKQVSRSAMRRTKLYTKEEERLWFSTPVKLNPTPLTNWCVITGRSLRMKGLTEKWFKTKLKCVPKIYFVGNDKLYDETIRYAGDKDKDEIWNEHSANGKSKLINKLRIKVYLEDRYDIVKRLREKCPDTVIIWYR